MKKASGRRTFLRNTGMTALSLGLTSTITHATVRPPAAGGRIGIIGLDTSHSIAFTKALNANPAPEKYNGFKVVAAYPRGSADIESSVKRIPGYIEEVKNAGVEIVDSIETLLRQTDFILLETNDGRPHLEQAIAVMRAGKTFFVDKPVAASLTDAITMYKLSARWNAPFFTSSSLRYMESAQEAALGKMGKVLGADCFSPATLEKTHPDLFWYGIHGVETLYTVMGTGCNSVQRTQTEGTDLVVGSWADGRIGTFRGTRTGKHEYGGMVFGEKGPMTLGPFKGYDNLLDHIIDFFKTGVRPVDPETSLEIYTFMEAAEESKRLGGVAVRLDDIFKKHDRLSDEHIKHIKR